MAQAGNTHQLLHGRGFGVVQHAADEVGAEFGDAQRAGGAVDVLRGHAQGVRAGEEGSYRDVVQGDGLGGGVGDLRQHVQDRRVHVAQTVQLDQNVMHGVEVEMGGVEVGIEVIRRVLHGGELADVVLLGHDDHAARVLTGGLLHALAAGGEAFLLGVAGLDAPLLEVLGHVAVSGLFRQTGNGASAEDVILAEELFHVMVGAVLIFAGEVQVDIGHLVALEAQEDLEGDVKAVLGQVLAAEGAVLVRQVNAHLVGGLVHVEEALAAVDAAVMGRERVDLRDAAHMRHEGRAHRAAGAHQIAVVVGLLHQLLGDVVQRRKAVADDGFELLFDAGHDDLRQLLAVHFLRAAPGHVLDIVRRVLPQGLEGVLALGVDGEELQFFDLVGDLFRVVDDHLMALFRAEVGKLLQHLVGGLEVQRRLVVRVLKAHAGLDDGAVLGVMGVEEVHIAGGDHGNAQLVAQLDDDAVEVAQPLFIGDAALA